MAAADEPAPPVEVEPAEVAELPEAEEAVEGEELAAAAEAPFAGAGEAEAEVEEKPEFEITEEELTASRKAGEEAAPLRVRPIRAKTPLEQGLRELTPDEIKESLEARKRAEQRRKVAVKPGAGKKAKAAADAKEIRELLTKFEEQKLQGAAGGCGADSPGSAPRRSAADQEGPPAPPARRGNPGSPAADPYRAVQGRRQARGADHPLRDGDGPRAC